MKDLLLWALVVVRTSKMKISRPRLADHVKKLHQKHAARAARLFFLIQPMKSLISPHCYGNAMLRRLHMEEIAVYGCLRTFRSRQEPACLLLKAGLN